MRYIVRFRDDLDAHEQVASELAAATGGRVIRTFSRAFKGFNLVIPSGVATSAVTAALAHDPRVLYVVPDQRLKLAGSESPVGWGLDRIDQGYAFGGPYTYDNVFNYYQTGAGVNIYIIDSGIDGSHSEFAGRLGNLSFTSVWPGDALVDCFGHGTAVASVAVGTTVGVAKGATVNSLQTAQCSDGTSDDGDVVDAIDFVISNGARPAVINLSMGSPIGFSNPLDDAVRSATNSGITVVVAAGNDTASACNYTPARVSQAITVAASTIDNQQASFSNYGTCVDLFAPGDGVQVATNTGGFGVGSGTSFAAPYVAGVAALLLQEDPSAGPPGVQQILTESATGGAIANPGAGTPNKLLFSLHTDLAVSGLSAVCGNATYTWTAKAWGGDGTRVFDWVVTYNDGDDELYPGPTNSTTFSPYIDRSIGDFDVQVSLYTNGEYYYRTMHVNNGIC